MMEIEFSQPHFQPNFSEQNNLSSQDVSHITNLITSLKGRINEVMRLDIC
jgi:hypothetical protein